MARIGTVAPTRREITPVQGARDPFSSMRPLVAALEDQAPAYASIQAQLRTRENVDTNMSLAIRDREEKITSSRLTGEFIGLKNELTRGVLKAYDEAEPGHAGFTEKATKEADEVFSKFMAKVPERLKPQFEADISAAREQLTNQAFELQVQSENSEFRRGVIGYASDIVERLNTSVISGIEDIDLIEEQALKELDKLFADNPLDRQSAEVFKEEIITSVKAAKLGRLTLEEMLDNASMGGSVPGQLVTEGTVVKSNRPVVAGLTAPMVGLLTSIAGPESAGEYNRMYSGDGTKRYFSDFSQHPNSPAEITYGEYKGQTSTAAGKYQFLYSTWKMAQEALGLPDFSPESQDLAAAWYAKKIYKDATGRDLESVLLSGHGPSIAAARKILAADIGWQGLRNVSDAQFVNTIAGATGNPSSLIYDEEFSSIPMADRIAIANDALARADSIRAAQQKEYASQRTSSIESLKFGINSGAAGQQEILNAQRKWNLTFEETQGLTKIFEEKMGSILDANRGTTIVLDPNSAFDPASADDKKAISAVFTESNVAKELAEGNQGYVDGLIKPTVEKTGYIPDVLANTLVSQMMSTNPQQAEFAMKTIASLQQINGLETTRSLGKEAVAAAALYNRGLGYIPQDQLMRFVRNELIGQDQQVIDAREKAINKIMVDAPADFTPVGIAANLGSEAPVDGLAGNVLAGEFRSLYTYFYTALGDHGAARDEAVKLLQTQWGETTTGDDTYLMKYPPQLTGVAAFNGSYDWIDRDIKASLKVPDGVGVRLVSDGRTEAQVANGQLPSYSVVVRDSFGMLRGLTLGDTALFDPKTDPPEVALLPLRYTPELTSDIQLAEFKTLETNAEQQQSIEAGQGPIDPLAYNYFAEKTPVSAEKDALKRAETPEQKIVALQQAMQLIPPEDRLDAMKMIANLGGPSLSEQMKKEDTGVLDVLNSGLEKIGTAADAAGTAIGEAVDEFNARPTIAPVVKKPVKQVISSQDVRALTAIGAKTGKEELVAKFSQAQSAEERRAAYEELMQSINSIPSGAVALGLRQQLATIYWRYSK